VIRLRPDTEAKAEISELCSAGTRRLDQIRRKPRVIIRSSEGPKHKRGRMNHDHGGNDVRMKPMRRVRSSGTCAGGDTSCANDLKERSRGRATFSSARARDDGPVESNGGIPRRGETSGEQRLSASGHTESAARTVGMRAPTRLRLPEATRLRSRGALERNNEVREVSREVRPATRQGKLWRRNPMGASDMK
jgi:hypothetical protein